MKVWTTLLSHHSLLDRIEMKPSPHHSKYGLWGKYSVYIYIYMYIYFKASPLPPAPFACWLTDLLVILLCIASVFVICFATMLRIWDVFLRIFEALRCYFGALDAI